MSSESQPLSMMTISAKRHDNNQLASSPVNSRSDLLTIRVLESFERKMQMIKELLTPEEFNSLAPNLLISTSSMRDESTRGSMDEELNDRIRRNLSGRLISGSSYSIRSEGTTDYLQQPSKQQPYQQRTKKSAKEHLVLKQQALDFFFTDQPTHTRSATTHRDLAIELRSSYYLSSPSTGHESKLLRLSGFGALDRVYAALEMIGVSFKNWMSSFEEQDHEDGSGIADAGRDFAKQSCDASAPLLGWPYGRMRNVEALRRRLQSDGQLEKVLAIRRVQRQSSDEHQGSPNR